MSTVTKIKGVINNYNLPVLTEQGLVPYWEGHFANALSEQGYTMTPAQKAAFEVFFNSLMDTNVINAIRYFWPFLGNSGNVNAAKVPLIGDKLFDFGAGFSDFQYNDNNEIMGITSCPAISSLNVLDFCDEHCVSLAASYIKEDTSDHEEKNSRVINAGDAIQLRVLQQGSSSRSYNIYCNTSTGKTTLTATKFPDNFDDAGNAYIALGFNDHSTAPYYNRYYKVNNGAEKATAGTDEPRTYTAPVSADRTKTLIALTESNFGVVQALTGLVVFNKVLAKEEQKAFMDALKTLNIALGKEVTV